MLAPDRCSTRFPIVDDPDEIVGIDVIALPSRRLEPALGLAEAALTMIAQADDDFIAGAVHASLAPWRQPLVWLPGAVPLTQRFLAIYTRWRAGGHRRGLAGSQAGRTLLNGLGQLGADSGRILSNPAASLYRPVLLDASGDADDGDWPGPIIDRTDARASFINIFRTTPERQQRLLEATRAIMPVATVHPGYRRTALHLGLDGHRLANYGQYATVAQIRSMYFHAETAKRFAAILAADVTEPATAFGHPLRLAGRPIGTPPRLRCYDVTAVALRD